jgi:predicted small lipoprotein YifL
MLMTRKEFLRSIAGAAGVAALAACGDEGGDPAADAAQRSCTANGTTVEIGSNHGHTMTVPKEDVVAGSDKTYQIQGASGHPHSVMVTAAMFTMLQNNMTVTATSSTDASHNHTITITCA